MAGRFSSIIKKIFIYVNIIVAAIYLLTCFATPYLDPTQWWYISLLSLAFPFLLVGMILFLILWLFIKPRYSVISAIAILVGFKGISVFFAFHISHTFHPEKDPQAIRIVTWNVARFIELKKNNNQGSQIRLKMMEQIREQNADILCLQEFQTTISNPVYYNNIEFIRKQLNYPYFYFYYNEDGSMTYYSSIIFSKYPIIDSGLVQYPMPTLPDVLIHADIKVNEDTIRVFTTHLQSLQFRKSDYDKISSIERIEKDSLIFKSRTIGSKLKKGIVYRSVQARIVKDELKKIVHPTLLCGDMNDIPNSYTYTTVRGNMQDAFLKKGWGVGRTFTGLSPTLRIDYIFADKNFQVLQFDRLVKNLSDHYMLVADLKLKR